MQRLYSPSSNPTSTSHCMKRSRSESAGENATPAKSPAKLANSKKNCATASQPMCSLPADMQRTTFAAPGSWARYYSIIEIRNVLGQSGLNQEWRVSPNSMCVLGLSSTHAAFAGGRRPIEVAFNPDLHVDFSGKKKKGAMHLEPTASICEVKCTDGSTYTVYRLAKVPV